MGTFGTAWVLFHTVFPLDHMNQIILWTYSKLKSSSPPVFGVDGWVGCPTNGILVMVKCLWISQSKYYRTFFVGCFVLFYLPICYILLYNWIAWLEHVVMDWTRKSNLESSYKNTHSSKNKGVSTNTYIWYVVYIPYTLCCCTHPGCCYCCHCRCHFLFLFFIHVLMLNILVSQWWIYILFWFLNLPFLQTMKTVDDDEILGASWNGRRGNMGPTILDEWVNWW